MEKGNPMKDRSDFLSYVFLFFLLVPGISQAANPKYRWQDHELEHVLKSHTEVIEESPHSYTISMGGVVDMDHALTKDYGHWRIGWQPNESIVISNIGTTLVDGLKLIGNKRGNWYSLDEIVQEATGGAKDEQETAYLVWNFVRSNRYHHNSLWNRPWQDEEHDPVKMLASYGGGLCDDTAKVGSMLFRSAGRGKNRQMIRGLHGHVVSEYWSNQRWQFMDADENAFYLDRENEFPVSGDTVSRDHEFAMCEFHYGPAFHAWESGKGAARYFGADDRRHEGDIYPSSPLVIRLRPSERIEFRWDNVGKFSSDQPDEDMAFFGNSRKIFVPRLNMPRADAEISKHVCLVDSEGEAGVASRGGEGELIYSMHSAFVIPGGQVRASFELAGEKDSASIAVKALNNKGFGNSDFIEIWKSSGSGLQDVKADIDEAIKPLELSPEYSFEVRIQLVSGSGERTAVMKKLEIQADTLVSPIFLPRLKLGMNEMAYSDQSDSRRLRIDHVWKETTQAKPLSSPRLIAPVNGNPDEEELVTYRWEAVPGAEAYHLQVSRDPAMRWPYRPSLDVILPAEPQSFAMPSPGMYAVNTNYYWRMRTRNPYGIWGDWSAIETFSWNGPCVPVNVQLTQQGAHYLV